MKRLEKGSEREQQFLLFLRLAVGIVGVVGVGVLAHDLPIDGAFFKGEVPHAEFERETCLDHSECGDVGPLIPLPVTSVHSGFTWAGEPGSERWEAPKLLFWMRHADMRGSDLFDLDCIEELILDSGFSVWPIPDNE